MKNISYLGCGLTLIGLLLLFTGCGPALSQANSQQNVTINKSFQSLGTPIPTVPPYRCGAWTNNAPNAFSTITIYAKLTRNIIGVEGARATAVAHFQNSDVTLDQQPASDGGGYVSFTLSLEGRQPRQVPATIGVAFTVGNATITCTPAFFTPN